MCRASEIYFAGVEGIGVVIGLWGAAVTGLLRKPKLTTHSSATWLKTTRMHLNYPPVLKTMGVPTVPFVTLADPYIGMPRVPIIPFLGSLRSISQHRWLLLIGFVCEATVRAATVQKQGIL